MRNRLAAHCLVVLAAVLVGGCNLPRQGSSGGSAPLEENTAAALTVEALGTQLARGTVSAPVSSITLSPMPSIPGATSLPAKTSTPSPTAGGGSAPAATATPGPSASPAAAATDIPCDRAKFDGETIPDGTVMTPGQTFTKTWTLKNDGSCTWNANYSLVFISGDAMDGPAATPLTTGTVAPGQSVQLSLSLRAPSSQGTYHGNFKLRNPAGVVFGLGPAANQNFWVEVKVANNPASMVDSYCLAEWTSDAGTLPCPGKTGDPSGFILRVDTPKLTDGSVDNEPALWTNPQAGKNGQISGRFLPVTISSGNHFHTVIGCFSGAASCDVTFALKYISDHGAVQSLGTWTEKQDGKMTHLDIDLTSLACHSVEFILNVTANTAADGQQAFWLDPKVQ